MMDDPLIHFLVPYVGRPDYLRECVSSILAQDDPRWLLTVVEDGPQGHEVEAWLAGLADDRVQYELNMRPRGLADNFQYCLSLASAPYLTMMGCDDRLLHTYVRHIARLLEEIPRPALVQPGVRVIGGNGLPRKGLIDRVKDRLRPRSSLSLLEGEEAAISLMRGNWLYFPSLCWRTEVVRDLGFREDLPTTLDLELVCRLILAGHTIAVAPDTLVFEYRRHSHSASAMAASTLTRFNEEGQVFGELERAFRLRRWSRAANSARWHLTSRLHALTVLPAALIRRDRAGASRILTHATGVSRGNVHDASR